MLIVSPILTFLTVAYRAPSSVKNASVLAISIRIGIIYLSLRKYLKRVFAEGIASMELAECTKHMARRRRGIIERALRSIVGPGAA